MSRRTKATSVFAVVIVMIAALAVLVIAFVPRYISETMSDFAALWNTTDALQHHVATTQQWPHDWETLAPALAYVDPAYSDGDISFASDRVEINFEIKLGATSLTNNWFVRLKSDRMKPEQDNANSRLRALFDQAPTMIAR